MKMSRQEYLDYLIESGNQDEYEAELEKRRNRRSVRQTPREETIKRMEREEAIERLLDASGFDPNFDLE